jgi:hypothetical protein
MKYLLFFSPLQQWLRERSPMLRHMYIVCLVLLYGKLVLGVSKLFNLLFIQQITI